LIFESLDAFYKIFWIARTNEKVFHLLGLLHITDYTLYCRFGLVNFFRNAEYNTWKITFGDVVYSKEDLGEALSKTTLDVTLINF